MRMGSSILQFIFRGMKGSGRRMSTSSIGKISSPWLMLPSSSSSEALYSKFYSLAETKVVSITKEAPPPPWAQGEVEHQGCSHGWVASYNRDNRQTFLSDPITGRHIKLPDVHTLSYSPSSHTWPSKIILSSPPSTHDCRAILTYGPCFHIAVCFPAHTSSTWLPVCGQYCFYSETVYSTHHNRLFCIAGYKKVECWDLESPSFVWKANLYLDEDNDKGYESSKYLMTDDHSGRLFLVIRKVVNQVGRDGSHVKSILLKCGDNDESYPHKTTSFEVYEIDAKDGKMRYMGASLDGFAMFVASNHSFVLPAADFNLRPNSIYFTDDLAHIYVDGGCIHDIGIFDYVDRKVSSIYYPSHVSQISHTLAPTMWFTPILH